MVRSTVILVRDGYEEPTVEWFIGKARRVCFESVADDLARLARAGHLDVAQLRQWLQGWHAPDSPHQALLAWEDVVIIRYKENIVLGIDRAVPLWHAGKPHIAHLNADETLRRADEAYRSRRLAEDDADGLNEEEPRP